MNTTQEAPALIQYACERCKTRFVLPPSSRRLGLGGKLRAFSSGLGKTLRYHEGLGSTYDAARRSMLAKMDDEAYQSFVQSFRFCHECRQFVCNECWSTSRRSCLTCVSKSMTGAVRPRPPFAPTGPEIPRPAALPLPTRRGRLRRDITLAVLAAAIVLLALEGGSLLAIATGAGNKTQDPALAVASATATASPTATATPAPTNTPAATPSATPAPTDTPAATGTPAPTASPSPSPTATPTPGVTAKPTPKITPVPPPPVTVIHCNPLSFAVSPTNVTCTVNSYTKVKGDVVAWIIDGAKVGSIVNYPMDTNTHAIQLEISRGGKNAFSNIVYIN
jgi:hypothetical protein